MRYALVFVVSLLTSLGLHAQQGQVEFGKNRVQYHNWHFDEWMKYESRHFVTTWYGTSRKIAETVTALAEVDFDYVRDYLEYLPSEKIRILVYTDLDDLKQSNIGDEEQFESAAGRALVKKNKIFVYFNGDHQFLRKQIRRGLVRILLQNMIVGDTWQEMIQNAALLDLPDWYVQGLELFISDVWTPAMTVRLHEELTDSRANRFVDIAERSPGFAGQAMFFFLNETYGKANLVNLVHLTRLNRSLEAAMINVYGTSLRDLTAEWRTFFMKRYEQVTRGRRPLSDFRNIPFRNPHRVPVTRLALSPDGRRLAYCLNEQGKAMLYVQDLPSDKRRRVFKTGMRNPFQEPDNNYPCFAWAPSGNRLAILYKFRDKLYLGFYDLSTGQWQKEELAPGFQDVHALDFVDEARLVFSATVNGFSDLFLYYPSNRQSRRLTADIWDDLDVHVTRLNNSPGIVFVSNRPDSLLRNRKLDTILPIGDFDVFYYNLDSLPGELVQITHTPFANERQPMGVDTSRIMYLSDRYGLYNREVATLENRVVGHLKHYFMHSGAVITVPADSVIADLDSTLVDSIRTEPVIRPQSVTRPVTDYAFSVERQTYQNGKLLDLVRSGRDYLLIPDTLHGQAVNIRDVSRLPGHTPVRRSRILEAHRDTLPPPDTPGYYFVTPFDDMAAPGINDTPNPSASKRMPDHFLCVNPGPVPAFQPSRITPMRIRFRLDRFTSTADNSLLFGGLDSYAGTPQDFTTPPLGILLKANFEDLFEDYELEGGLRFNLAFNRMEYFLQYKDKKHRLDRQYGLYLLRQNHSDNSANFFIPRTVRNQTVIATSQWKYPLDIYQSFRATATLRFDRALQASTDSFALWSPIIREKRAGLKLEYVFDNSLDVYPNIKNGTRMKCYAEVVKKYNIDLTDQFQFALAKGFMGILGFDARHYQRLLKHSIAAIRVAGATSFGREKLLYLMGGPNNWILPQYDRNIPVPAGNFAYRTLVADLRGFKQNTRNGNSFLLLNQELRLPLFRYLSRRPARSTFLNNVQFVAFLDAGVAWSGKSPFDPANPLNSTTVTATDGTGTPTIQVHVQYFRDPMVWSYGVGLRMLLFGYPVRLDYARGVETRQVQRPVWQVSLGSDF